MLCRELVYACVMQKDITEFLTPQRSTVKRRRSSPELSYSVNKSKKENPKEITTSKISDTPLSAMDNMAELADVIGRVLDKKLIALATKDDFNALRSDLSEINKDNKIIKEELVILKSENDAMKNRLIELEDRSRRNNLIFRGLEYEGGDAVQAVKNFCVKSLGLNERDLSVNRAHPLGRGKNGPIIAHIPSDTVINSILKSCKNLKGTKYFVQRDYSMETRKGRARLIRLRKEISVTKGFRKMPLVHDRLLIEGRVFTWSGEKLMAGKEDGETVLSQILRCETSEIIGAVRVGERRSSVESA